MGLEERGRLGAQQPKRQHLARRPGTRLRGESRGRFALRDGVCLGWDSRIGPCIQSFRVQFHLVCRLRSSVKGSCLALNDPSRPRR